jgi:hypothetical protein
MYADNTKRFGCVDCGYFTDVKCNIYKHNQTKSHKKKLEPLSIINDEDCSYKCKNCNNMYKCKSGLWRHNQKCQIVKDMKPETTNNDLQEQILALTSMVTIMAKNQQAINVTNNNNINITNNIHIFLNNKCKDAMDMSEFIEGIKFCTENFTGSNLLMANALEHTAKIFENRLNEMTVYERPIHNFTGEDQNQMISHYRHNNEWKSQSELSILDEIYRDYEGNEPKDSFVYYMGMFHRRRLEYFNENYSNKSHLVTNLRYTTYSEQQIDLARKVLEMTRLEPISL